jgi:hypothetical protein
MKWRKRRARKSRWKKNKQKRRYLQRSASMWYLCCKHDGDLARCIAWKVSLFSALNCDVDANWFKELETWGIFQLQKCWKNTLYPKICSNRFTSVKETLTEKILKWQSTALYSQNCLTYNNVRYTIAYMQICVDGYEIITATELHTGCFNVRRHCP